MQHWRRTNVTHGQGALEYAIVLGLIAVVVVASVTIVGRSTKGALCSVAAGLSGGVTNYSKAVLADCPAAYWRMDEPGGTVAADSSGNNHPGTYNGVVALGQPGAAPKQTGTAMSLDGTVLSNGFLSATVPASVQFSVEVWVKSGSSTLWNEHGFISSARGANGWIIHPYKDTGTVTEYIVDALGGGASSVCGFTALDIGSWHQYALTFDGSVGTGYFDGALACGPQSVNLTRTSVGTVAVDFGLDQCCATRLLAGSIDEASIYTKALTAAQVASHFNAAVG